MKVCRQCGKELDDRADVCTQCGRKCRKPAYRKWWFWMLMGFATMTTVVAVAQSANTGWPANVSSETTSVVEEQVIEVSAKELLDTYRENEAAFDSKYKSRLVKVTGIVDRVSVSGGSTYVYLDTGDYFELSAVRCEVSNKEQAAKLAKDQTVTIQGRVSNVWFGDITVRNCTIIG